MKPATAFALVAGIALGYAWCAGRNFITTGRAMVSSFAHAMGGGRG